jgi:hypothetical protein
MGEFDKDYRQLGRGLEAPHSLLQREPVETWLVV